MKQNGFSQNPTRKSVGAARSVPPGQLIEREIDLASVASEVTDKVCFCYVNEGSRRRRQVQHWLKAEADLFVDRNLARFHALKIPS
jgi:hypothetical protein